MVSRTPIVVAVVAIIIVVAISARAFMEPKPDVPGERKQYDLHGGQQMRPRWN